MRMSAKITLDCVKWTFLLQQVTIGGILVLSAVWGVRLGAC